MPARGKVINNKFAPSSVHATFIFALGYSLELGHITQRPYCHLGDPPMGPDAEQWFNSDVWVF